MEILRIRTPHSHSKVKFNLDKLVNRNDGKLSKEDFLLN